MCEITKNNFEEKYDEIINDLQSASFIAIDCEFSGLFDNDRICSLFDSPKTRFYKLQTCLEKYEIIQMGISTFKYERTSNTFTAASYSFYLKPSPFVGNQKFSCHIKSIEFLCNNKFDFNKLFYNGINYLNKTDEAKVLSIIEEGGLIDLDNKENIQKYCSRIAEWKGTKPNENEMLLEVTENNKIFIYLLSHEIRKRFSDIWTCVNEKNFIRVTKVSKTEKELLSSNTNEDVCLKKKIFDLVLGFSKVLKEMQKLHKPIIGHNIFLDLIMIYKQFYNPFHVSYKKFKRDIIHIFPNIYDTKCMSFKLRSMLSKENAWKSNILSDLYQYLKDGKGATLVIFTPVVYHKTSEYTKNEHYHEAGFDSYCTGFCFLKMAHIFSLWDSKKKSFQLTSLPTSSAWLLGAVSSMKNQVNISRGQVNYISLDGEDPKSIRPGLLYIQSKSNQPLIISNVTELMAKYAMVDIQLLNKYNGLLAVGNQKEVQEILKYFKDHKNFKVTKYSFFKHSNLGKKILSGSVIALILITVFISKHCKKLRL